MVPSFWSLRRWWLPEDNGLSKLIRIVVSVNGKNIKKKALLKDAENVDSSPSSPIQSQLHSITGGVSNSIASTNLPNLHRIPAHHRVKWSEDGVFVDFVNASFMASSSILSFSLPKPNLTKASSASTTAPAFLPDTLDRKFGRKGIKFYQSGDIPMVELTVRNGSSLKLQIPTAHVTSYKPKVYWKDDGFEEVLYTLPADGQTSTHAKGGVGLVINDASDPNYKGSLFEASEWIVKDVDSDSIDALQVELSCRSGTLDITYVVSLYPLSMATAVIVKNNGRKAVNLTSAILTHFKSKKRSGTGVQGLRTCSYCTFPPPSSQYEILSPPEALKSEDPGLFSFGWEPERKPGEWSIQDVPFTVLKHKLSRVYSAPPAERTKEFYSTIPSNYEILDQGRELFFRVIRMGFEDIYLSSPGSFFQKYGKDYFICTGPASVLVPVLVNPGEEWKGAQVIEHDNL